MRSENDLRSAADAMAAFTDSSLEEVSRLVGGVNTSETGSNGKFSKRPGRVFLARHAVEEIGTQ
jgi:hypothetical protein